MYVSMYVLYTQTQQYVNIHPSIYSYIHTYIHTYIDRGPTHRGRKTTAGGMGKWLSRSESVPRTFRHGCND